MAETFHASGAARLHSPSSSAHISSHNAVRATRDPGIPERIYRQHTRLQTALAASHRTRLDIAYAKACARAKKKGRRPPEREQIFYDHWGYPYVYGAPYVYPLWWTSGLYPGWFPAHIATCAPGSWASCAEGTCGGGVAAGACGGSGVSYLHSLLGTSRLVQSLVDLLGRWILTGFPLHRAAAVVEVAERELLGAAVDAAAAAAVVVVRSVSAYEPTRVVSRWKKKGGGPNCASYRSILV